jgi:iron uptake system component EfeO
LVNHAQGGRFVSRAQSITRFAALVVLAVAGLAACGGAPASVGPATPVPSGVIPVEAKDYAFDPAAITAPGGPVTFSVRNTSGQEHQFEIFSGETLVDGVLEIGGGQTKDLTVTLAAGSYTFICTLNGHDQLGMKGTLTVE